MEPVNYRDALRRRWLVAVALALVGAIVGGLFPEHAATGHTQFEASALMGVAPGASKGPSALGAPTTLAQIKFFAANEQVIADAAKTAGIKGKTTNLLADIVFPANKKKKKSKSFSPAGTLRVTVEQPTAKRSADLTNAFVHSLINYINGELISRHKAAIRGAEQKVSNISNQL